MVRIHPTCATSTVRMVRYFYLLWYAKIFDTVESLRVLETRAAKTDCRVFAEYKVGVLVVDPYH